MQDLFKKEEVQIKVNSSDNSEEENIGSKLLQTSKSFSRLHIDNKNIKELNFTEKD